jgi:alpha-D-xyloside xylohydrolase
VQLRWNDAKRQLQVAAREGSFPGLVKQRQLQVRLMAGATTKPAPSRNVTYRGQALTLQFP